LKIADTMNDDKRKRVVPECCACGHQRNIGWVLESGL
jgi:hypothetical protein